MLRLSRTCEDTGALLGNAHRAHSSGGQQLLNMLRPSSCVNSTVEKFQFGKWRRLGVRLEMFISLDAGAWLEERGEGEQQHAALGVDHSEHHGGDRETTGVAGLLQEVCGASSHPPAVAVRVGAGITCVSSGRNGEPW